MVDSVFTEPFFFLPSLPLLRVPCKGGPVGKTDYLVPRSALLYPVGCTECEEGSGARRKDYYYFGLKPEGAEDAWMSVGGLLVCSRC